MVITTHYACNGGLQCYRIEKHRYRIDEEKKSQNYGQLDYHGKNSYLNLKSCAFCFWIKSCLALNTQ